MYRRDYIMRQIEYMVEVLQRVSGLVEENRYQAAMTMIDESLHDLFGLNGTLINRQFGQESLSQLSFGEASDVRQAKFIAAAALLKEAGEVQADQGAEKKSVQSFMSALELLLIGLLSHGGSPLPEYAPEVEEITAVLTSFYLPTHLNQLLLRYYHLQNQFDQAENVLFEMREQDPEDASIVAMGITFYQQILAKDDAHLEAGNLPRDEAEASLAELLASHKSNS